ncbi:MAG: hypothetical protein B7Y26_08540 [Hydrogenophilales bacterium 16-64-46]|nr:MAG: hypothetical protein B7Z32_03895 [Hydrogenophilales bacterium 12-64-13]OYZ05315.1 MAG: hypothetical protein B7Y26_08540 [Hydrogenophilales bacterium 16-64-46]OZA37129.1 MAG: hypothetical protein B7X87_12585 [Hydrogenophilales bacterium 17-64-34]HQS99388.1 hypothetical protein [Thiobacillus sp.]
MKFLVATLLSLALHAGLLAFWPGRTPLPPDEPPLELRIVARPAAAVPTPPAPRKARAMQASKRLPAARPAPARLASMAAPPAPSAEEWALASTYTLRNGKRYRYNWGRQVRSLMGTAVEGQGTGQVRFRVEIAADGSLAQVKELWSTSEAVSRRAREAIAKLPPLPPSPGGKPLVFEQTIAFMPYETGWPPSYRLDCLPEPATFKNPFAWNGGAPQGDVSPRAHRPDPPEGCPPDGTAATIEEEEQEFARQMDQWRWGR